jgi:hypothetical protein
MELTDIGQLLGALAGEPRDVNLTVFVPSETRDGVPIDHEFWRDETLRVMAKLFGGATAVRGTGAWRDDERGAAVQLEYVSVVVSFTSDASWNPDTVKALGAFLHRMGRETSQGQVGVAINGQYLPIQKFDL